MTAPPLSPRPNPDAHTYTHVLLLLAAARLDHRHPNNCDACMQIAYFTALAGRPPHLPPAEDVHMQVVDALRPGLAVVDHQPVAVVEIEALGHLEG